MYLQINDVHKYLKIQTEFETRDTIILGIQFFLSSNFLIVLSLFIKYAFKF